MVIREYRGEDEKEWVYCRVLSFLNTSYFDDIRRKKEIYENSSLSIVAEKDGKIIGILDIEYERKEGELCYLKGELGGVIWNIAVLPEYRNISVATKMLNYAKMRLIELGIRRFEAWIQEDEEANNWYIKQGFERKLEYLNAFVKGNSTNKIIKKFINLNDCGDIFGVRVFNFEASIERKEELKEVCYRLHEVRLYELKLT